MGRTHWNVLRAARETSAHVTIRCRCSNNKNARVSSPMLLIVTINTHTSSEAQHGFAAFRVVTEHDGDVFFFVVIVVLDIGIARLALRNQQQQRQQSHHQHTIRHLSPQVPPPFTHRGCSTRAARRRTAPLVRRRGAQLDRDATVELFVVIVVVVIARGAATCLFALDRSIRHRLLLALPTPRITSFRRLALALLGRDQHVFTKVFILRATEQE